ncbi:AAA family ATPase [Vibrio fluvialis]|uniref:AAA family ATPase n=1 Tax=Vibrio fluvialis TaxID=676 RepID=UPI001C9D333E|nr:AAA family ATPase [Vibrio fluvialis]MBY8273596.1 AAA family ATPase [Vibrio fluvialis]MCE7624270.1 AAA family ATPase [Vibrio fluvialis]
MSDSTKIPKYVKDKIRQSKQGDLYSCFTVSEYYYDGDILERDIEKSEQYLRKVSRIVDNAKIRFKSISLYDYKRFSHLKFASSEKNTTVIIGNNGSGKSSILESISKCLQFLSDNIRIQNNNNYKFQDSEINIHSHSGQTIVRSILEIENEFSFSCSLTKNKENISRKVSSELEEFKALASMYQRSNELDNNKLSYPLLAYYPVERSVILKREDAVKYNERKKFKFDDKSEGLKNAFDGTSNFNDFFTWYKELDDIINEFKAKDSITKEELELLLTKDKEKIGNLISKLLENKTNNINIEDKENLIKQQKVIQESIKTFVSDIEQVKISRTPYLDMTVIQNGSEISIFNLSQGERTLIALVSDIARRLVILNPNLENPLAGHGIVLIDEIDLHLHPKWQKTIVQKLEKTFPNIQFIVSTHSALVLTTVTSEQIKIINELESGFELLSPTNNPFGKKTSDALAIMDTSEAPLVHSENTLELINKYQSLVKSGREDDRRAKEIKKRVESTGYTFDKADIEMWRFIAENREFFVDSLDNDD